MKKILILCFNFPPDFGACAFRMENLVQEIRAKAPGDVCFTILTTLPNHYDTTPGSAPKIERIGAIKIVRFCIPAHKSGLADRSLAYCVFALKVLTYALARRWDGVFATSARLMTAVLGAQISLLARARLYLDIRDIFTLALDDVLPPIGARMAGPIFRLAEKWAFRRALAFSVTSPEFIPHIQAAQPRASVKWVPHAIPTLFCNPDWGWGTAVQNGSVKTMVIVGNIGKGQDLHHILPHIARGFEQRIRIEIYGGGGSLALLKQALAHAACPNVKIYPPVSRTDLVRIYQQADMFFLNLAPGRFADIVYPSKIFELMVTGKPLVAGVGQAAKTFLGQHAPNGFVFPPSDIPGAMAAVEAALQVHKIADMSGFAAEFSTQKQFGALVEDIVNLP